MMFPQLTPGSLSCGRLKSTSPPTATPPIGPQPPPAEVTEARNSLGRAAPREAPAGAAGAPEPNCAVTPRVLA